MWPCPRLFAVTRPATSPLLFTDVRDTFGVYTLKQNATPKNRQKPCQKTDVVEINLFLFILDDFTDEDSNWLEKIKKTVLMPTKNREDRKVRVNKYLHWVRENTTVIHDIT